VIVQALVDYARYIKSNSRFIVTWHDKINVTWKNWDIGSGHINIWIEQGDVLLVKGRDNVVFILVITMVDKYDFFAQIIGVDYGHQR